MLVHVSDVLGQAQVAVSIWLVLNQPQQVETGEQSSWKLDVLLDALPGIVAAICRISGC